MKNGSKNGRLLLLIQLPPPAHGTSLDNQRIANSTKLREDFEVKLLQVPSAFNSQDLNKWRIKKILLAAITFVKLLKTLFVFRPDIVYSTPAPEGPAFYRDIMYAVILKLFPCEVFYRIKGEGFSWGGRVKRGFSYFLFLKANLILLSEKLKDDVKSFVSLERISCLPNGIPVPDEEITYNSDYETVNFLYIANLRKEKGVEDLLSATVILKKETQNFTVTFVGPVSGDKTVRDYQKQAKKLGIDEFVRFVGPKYGKDKENIFKTHDVFVFPSRRERFPFVLLEAMCFGLPVISTDIAAIPEIVIDGQTGFIVPPRSTEKLAKKMKLFCDQQGQLINKMGQRAQERYKKNYTFSKMIKGLIAILQKSAKI